MGGPACWGSPEWLDYYFGGRGRASSKDLGHGGRWPNLSGTQLAHRKVREIMKSHCRGLGASGDGDTRAEAQRWELHRLVQSSTCPGRDTGRALTRVQATSWVGCSFEAEILSQLLESRDLELPETVTQLKWLLILCFVPSTPGTWSWVPRGVKICRVK